MNYNETGYVLTKTDSNEQDALVALTMTFKNTATNKSVTLKADALFYNLGITEAGEYLTYWNATGSDYYAVGSFTVLPYWITPDTITVTGVNTRTITLSAMTRTGITKQDQQ